MQRKEPRQIKGMTVRPEAETTVAFAEICKDLGTNPSTVVVHFLRECVKSGRIPLEYLPEKVVARLRRIVEDTEKAKFFLGEKHED